MGSWGRVRMESGWDEAPPEILSQIFEFTLPEGLEASLPIPTVAPLLLTHVCFRWRETSHSTPKLWAKCNLSCSSSHRDPRRAAERLAAKARLWLQHSGDIGVSFGLRFPLHHRWRSWHHSQIANRVRDALTELTLNNPFADRIRGLDLVWPGDLSTPLPISVGTLSRLEAFAIDIPQGYNASYDAYGAPLVSSHSPLRRLHIGRTVQNAYGPPQSVPMKTIPDWPWERLTHLSLVAVALPLSQGREVLQLCRDLEELSLCIDSASMAETPGLDIGDVRMDIPFLRSLDIRFTSSPSFRILNSTKLPALRKLTVRAFDLDDKGDGPSPHFLDQLSGLKSLSLYAEGGFSKPLFRRFLQAVPHLSQLSISTEHFLALKYVFKMLTIQSKRENTRILLSLRNISTYCSRADTSGSSVKTVLSYLQSMADSRAQTDPPCMVAFAVVGGMYGSFDSETNMRRLLGPFGVAERMPYLSTAYYGPDEVPPGVLTSFQRNPLWTAS